MDFRDLPVHPQDDSHKQLWLDWAAQASDAQLFEAFVCRLSLSRVSQPDLEPTSLLLANRLREHLQGGQV